MIRTFEGHTAGSMRWYLLPMGAAPSRARGTEHCGCGTWRVASQCASQGHTGWVNAVAVTPDGNRAISASLDRTLRVWDLESGQSLYTLEGHKSPVLIRSPSPDGERAISASSDRTLRVWDLESGQSVRTLEGHLDAVNAVAVTPDGERAISASSDRTLRVWDLERANWCARSKAIWTQLMPWR